MEYKVADFMDNKGWECPVCHIGLAPTCQACPECIRAKNAPKDSSYATDKMVVTKESKPITVSINTYTAKAYTTSSNVDINIS